MIADLALQRDKYRHLSDDEWRWFLQQTEGRERTADKLPTFAAIEDWWYPVRLSCEQCSSEATARYKAELVESRKSKVESRFVDLTGGYGVDTFFLSEHFAHTDYVEQNAELCRIAEHNFQISRKTKVERQKLSITVHNCAAEDFLSSSPCADAGWDLIFLDPARRDSHGGKVFRLADCTPNVIELLPTLLDRLAPNGRIMLKLSPMLDITQAVKELSAFSIQWSVFVVAIKNEVKEVLLISRNIGIPEYRETGPTITAIDLAEPEKAFVFARREESDCAAQMANGTWSSGAFLYEPNAAILKAGAYKLAGERFGLQKLDTNTHLYVSPALVAHFPGRVWQIKSEGVKDERMKELNQANVLCRNYPLTAEQLKKKMHLRDGGADFIIGCRVAGKPVVFLAERI
jgi:16S rRNA G966 N2-methylase RsmD